MDRGLGNVGGKGVLRGAEGGLSQTDRFLVGLHIGDAGGVGGEVPVERLARIRLEGARQLVVEEVHELTARDIGAHGLSQPDSRRSFTHPFTLC